MKVEFEFIDGVVVLTYDGVVIDDDATFEAWSRQVRNGLRALYQRLGGRFALAVCVDGLRLSRKYGPRYSAEVARPAAEKYLAAVARYGRTGRTTAVIAIEAHNRAMQGHDFARDERFTANVFTNRDEAVDFLKSVAPAQQGTTTSRVTLPG